MKAFIKKYSKLSLIAIAVVVVLAGCGEEKETAAPVNSDAASTSTEAAQVIKVGTAAIVKNVSYLDDAGKLTGYDVEVVREIDNRLSQYEFKFETMDFPNLFLSLDSKKIDFIAMHLEQNEERRAKYLFNKEFYDSSALFVAVNEANASIQSIDDLKGKTVIVPASSSSAAIIEKYNREHQNEIKVVYGDYTNAVNQLKSGRADATVMDGGLADSLNRDADAQLKKVGDNLHSESGVYFAFRQEDGSALSAAIDEALGAMKSDGTLTKLANQWLKRDYQFNQR